MSKKENKSESVKILRTIPDKLNQAASFIESIIPLLKEENLLKMAKYSGFNEDKTIWDETCDSTKRIVSAINSVRKELIPYLDIVNRTNEVFIKKPQSVIDSSKMEEAINILKEINSMITDFSISTEDIWKKYDEWVNVTDNLSTNVILQIISKTK